MDSGWCLVAVAMGFRLVEETIAEQKRAQKRPSKQVLYC